MRKLKKALSLVLAIALVLGLCTIGAAAIETPNGEYEGGLTIEYHVTANDLSRLLAVEGYGANAEVDDLRLIFKDDLTPGIDSLDLIWNEASDSYGSVAYSNYMDVQPNCIKSLAIKLSDGRNLEVSESDLTANYIGTGSHIYELSLTEADETYLVTFWAQQGDALHWTRYSVVAVEKGGTVGDKMPADPDTGNYVFIGWELGSHDGSGSKFTADTVVNADIDVYARKVSVGRWLCLSRHESRHGAERLRSCRTRRRLRRGCYDRQCPCKRARTKRLPIPAISRTVGKSTME